MVTKNTTRDRLVAELTAERRRTPTTRQSESHVTPWFRSLENDEQFRQLLEHMRAVITEVDTEGRVTYVSSTVEAVSGFAPEELIGRTTDDRIHTDDLPELLSLQQDVTKGRPSARAVFRSRHKDGLWRWVETSAATRFTAADGTIHSVTFSRDVTEVKQAMDALRESEERYRIVVESSDSIVVESDPIGRTVFVTPNIEDLLGYTPEQLIDVEPFQLIHPDDRPRLVEQFQKAVETLATSRLDAYRVRHADGSWRWFQSAGIGYRHASGEIRFLNVTRDITNVLSEAKRRREFDARLQQTQRLESLGIMAGGVAHDFNNLLTPILGDATLALSDVPADSPLRPHLERIQRTARRAAELTRQMLAYAGADEIESEPVVLPSLVHDMSRLLETVVSAKTVLEYDLSPDTPPVLGDPGQLTQVVMNLLTNAAEALEDSDGRIVVRTRTLDLEHEKTVAYPESPLPAGRYVALEVEDTGCGMTPETVRRIFDPFFTTKFTGRGLGLAAVLGILRAHGGAIDIVSTPDLGTRFQVLFPPAEVRANRPAEDQEPQSDRTETATVLVIDDDQDSREITADCLRHAGLEVISAEDGEIGAEIFRVRSDEIHIVVLDSTMPGLSGPDTFDRIRSVQPDARIVLMSGYAKKSASETFAHKSLAGFVRKPYLPDDLVTTVRSALENRDA